MTFLYPSFLWALGALAIPIIVHFFNFRRTKRVFFTNVAFLKQVDTTTSSFRRLKHLLVMLARMAFILCLVVAFAQPFLPSKNQTKNALVGISSIYLDNSMSMQNEVDNKSYLDFAVNNIENLLSIYQNSSTQLQLVTNNFDAPEHRVHTSEQLKDRMASVNFSHNYRSLSDVYNRQSSLANKYKAGGQHTFFWFSDFQKSTVGDLSRLKPDSNTRLILMPIQNKATENIYVDSVWLATPFVREMQANTLWVKLHNTGNKAVDGLPIKLSINNVQVASQLVTLAAQQSITISFPLMVKAKGVNRGRISFDDQPIIFDNDYFFVVNASPSIQVVHLFGQKSGNYIENVFSNDSLFVRHSYPITNADVGQLSTANLVVLEGINQLSGTLRSEIQAFITRGGSLVIIPPNKVDVLFYKNFLAEIGIQLANISLEPMAITPLAEPIKQGFFGDIFEKNTKKDLLSMPSAASVWQWQAIGEKLLTFRSGQNFLTQSVWKQGKVYIMASPLDASAGDFAQHALFVPVMYQLAAQSVQHQPLAYSFGNKTFQLEIPQTIPNAIFKLKNGKTTLIPIQRLNGKFLTIELPQSNQLQEGNADAGYYELQQNDKIEQVLAINHANTESVMSFYNVAELKDIFGGQKNVQIFENIEQNDDFVQHFQEQNIGKSLWKYFVVAALLFLLIETFLIRFLKG